MRLKLGLHSVGISATKILFTLWALDKLNGTSSASLRRPQATCSRPTSNCLQLSPRKFSERCSPTSRSQLCSHKAFYPQCSPLPTYFYFFFLQQQPWLRTKKKNKRYFIMAYGLRSLSQRKKPAVLNESLHSEGGNITNI